MSVWELFALFGDLLALSWELFGVSGGLFALSGAFFELFCELLWVLFWHLFAVF